MRCGNACYPVAALHGRLRQRLLRWEQLAVMLWQYAGSPSAAGGELRFADAYRASNWAPEALRWATQNGIINGKGSGILDSTGQATRAETAQMLKNFMEKQ
ncbi:MAG: S-layer homology domain-containing protein [Clostridiales bacterium]|nr:S-layer homology domain-containing protein [Clostridiales bacterium]